MNVAAEVTFEESAKMRWKEALAEAARFNAEFAVNVLFDLLIVTPPLWLTCKAAGLDFAISIQWSFGTACVLNYMACILGRSFIKVTL